MHIGNVRGLPSPSPASSCCLTQIETETLASFFFFFVPNVLISVTAIDSIQHPATWQWATFRGAAASPLNQPRVFLCTLRACFCVRGRAGNGRMRSWQRAVTPTPPACLCWVPACLISVLKSGSKWDLCLRSGSDTAVLSTLFQVRCLHVELSGHMLSWLDFSWETEAPLQRCFPSRWRFEEFAHGWAPEWHHPLCQIGHAILLTRSHMSRDIAYHTEIILLFFSSL